MKKQLICLGHSITIHTTTGNYDMIEGVTLPQVPGPPPHYHSAYQELFFVLEGKLEFIVDGKSVAVGMGESIDLPPHTPHTFINPGNEPSRWLNIHSPKGFLSFFEEFGVDVSEENAFGKSVDEKVIQSVIERSASFDMHLVS